MRYESPGSSSASNSSTSRHKQRPESPGVLHNDTKLPPVDLGAVGVSDHVAEAAQGVEKRQCITGDGCGPDPGYRDPHSFEERRVVAGVGCDMVFTGVRNNHEQPLHRAVEVVQLQGQALEARGTGYPFPLIDAAVDGGDLEELRPNLRRKRYKPVRVHLSPVRRIESAK